MKKIIILINLIYFFANFAILMSHSLKRDQPDVVMYFNFFAIIVSAINFENFKTKYWSSIVRICAFIGFFTGLYLFFKGA